MLEQYFSNLGIIITFIGLTLMLVGVVYATINATTINDTQNVKSVDQKMKPFYLATSIAIAGILLLLLATSLN